MTFKGTVTDAETGMPLIGATVRVMNADGTATPSQVSTDFNGGFSITTFVSSPKFQISYLGYQTLLTDGSVTAIKLSPATSLTQTLAGTLTKFTTKTQTKMPTSLIVVLSIVGVVVVVLAVKAVKK